MKYIDPITKEKKTIYTKASDTLPLGAIVDFDGEEIPAGWEEIIEPEDATVYIGPNEPTDGQDIWIQKGKNLFNPNNVNYTKWLSEEGEPYTANEGDIVTSFIDVLPNINYTISGLVAAQWLVVCGYDINKNFVALLLPSTGSSGISWTINVPSNVAYIRCGFSGFNSSATAIQIEQGDTSTAYEPFTRKIYTKSNNDVYEEFYNEDKLINITTGVEFETGRIIDGKKEYGKRFKPVELASDIANIAIATGLGNINFIKLEGSIIKSDGTESSNLPYMYSGQPDIYHYYSDRSKNITIRQTGAMTDFWVTETIYYTKN